MPHRVQPTRRAFLGMATMACTAPGLTAARNGTTAREIDPALVSAAPFAGPLCLFTKPLVDVPWGRLAADAKALGFDGLDLTVRPGGHVLPERAADDLPRALDAARAEGIGVPMITTALTDVDSPGATAILATAGRLGIRYMKAGYYQYGSGDVRAEIVRAGRAFARLVELAASHGVHVGYHNHEDYIGGAVWDAASFIEPLERSAAGYYFDPRHAVAEGGAGAWRHALDLVARRVTMLAVKDFVWTRTSQGWRDPNVPLGEGMVDWRAVFAVLARARFSGPISLHLEYDVPGDTPDAHHRSVLDALRRDLAFLEARIVEARQGQRP